MSYRSVAHGSQLSIALLADEYWWGGAVADGVLMPFSVTSTFSRDLSNPGLDTTGLGNPSNQLGPVLVSSRGRVVFSQQPFSYTFYAGTLTVTNDSASSDSAVTNAPNTNEIEFGETDGATLRDAFLALVGRYFQPSGRFPALDFISHPQYNTWIEMPYQPTQECVLAYANRIVTAGMPPGVIMIDDNWAPNYGDLYFEAERFPNPKAMCEELHQLGFKVMLWLVPFINRDAEAFSELASSGYLLRDANDEIAIRQWWNGHSATLDISNPHALAWLKERLDALVTEFGVDGFKFDAGDIRDYRDDDQNFGQLSPVEMCEAWSRFATQYPFNEMRASWKNAGQPLVQRLEDKPPSWGADGIGALIPNLLAQGLLGHPYTCPDMVGGGEITAMSALGEVDQEFFVRYTQVAALSPMIQFSSSPCRLLDDAHFAAVKRALAIRELFLPTMLELAREAAVSGEPIIRPMAYHAPALASNMKQFFLGADVIVAPIMAKGASSHEVWLPTGDWRADDGIRYHIATDFERIEVSAELDRLPYFTRIS